MTKDEMYRKVDSIEDQIEEIENVLFPTQVDSYFGNSGTISELYAYLNDLRALINGH